MGKNKKFAILITEEKNGRNETSTIYADSVTDAMNYINLIKNKKASIKIIDTNENLIHTEIFNPNEEKKEKKHDKNDENEHLHHYGNGHWGQGGHHGHDDDDDDMYA